MAMALVFSGFDWNDNHYVRTLELSKDRKAREQSPRAIVPGSPGKGEFEKWYASRADRAKYIGTGATPSTSLRRKAAKSTPPITSPRSLLTYKNCVRHSPSICLRSVVCPAAASAPRSMQRMLKRPQGTRLTRGVPSRPERATPTPKSSVRTQLIARSAPICCHRSPRHSFFPTWCAALPAISGSAFDRARALEFALEAAWRKQPGAVSPGFRQMRSSAVQEFLEQYRKPKARHGPAHQYDRGAWLRTPAVIAPFKSRAARHALLPLWRDAFDFRLLQKEDELTKQPARYKPAKQPDELDIPLSTTGHDVERALHLCHARGMVHRLHAQAQGDKQVVVSREERRLVDGATSRTLARDRAGPDQ